MKGEEVTQKGERALTVDLTAFGSEARLIIIIEE